MEHPLDRIVWNALTTRQAQLSQGDGRILRYRPEYAPFAATSEGSAESYAGLASLVSPGDRVVLVLPEEIAPPPGLDPVRIAEMVQMVAQDINGADPEFDYGELADADAPEMIALAKLTNPGPFLERTNQLGRFIGVRHEGKLVAMAGERMKVEGFTEVSGVCTDPDFRGRGYAAGLMRVLSRAILAAGETPLLHTFADNHGAIALYERLGFAVRWRPTLMILERPEA